MDIAHERGIEQGFCLDLEVITGLAFTLGVGDKRRHQLQDILLTADVGKGVIAHGFAEVDGVEDLDLVAFPQ